MMGLTQTVAPSDEPLTLAETKTAARVSHSADDTLLTDLVKAGRERCERVSGRQLVTATWKLTLDSFSDKACCAWDANLGWVIYPPKLPLQSVPTLKYMDTAGTLQTLASTEYQVDAAAGRIAPAYGKTWPVSRAQLAAIEITFVAGYGAPAAVPLEIKERLKAYVTYCYEHRVEIDEAFLDRIFQQFWTGQL